MTSPLPPDAECALLNALRAADSLFVELTETRESELQRQQRLRSKHSPELVRAALTLADLRLKARVKFSRADVMWFSPKGLEQATSEAIARHKSQRFSDRGSSDRVWDYCCGIGADSIALAERGIQVEAVDLVPANCLRTQWNAEAYGVSSLIQTHACDIASLSDRSGWLHIDPDRRPVAGRRVVRLEDCMPDLQIMQTLTKEFRGGALKLSPASNFGGKFESVEVELVSLHGECKEATIWFGELAGSESHRATVLPSGETIAADPLSAWTNVGELGAFLYDPDPAIVRSGLVDVLAERLGLRRLDDAEEYLTSDERVVSPFLQAFEVVENVPNNDREIRASVRRAGFGQIEIKCRHIPIQVEAMRRSLPLEGIDPGVLIFTRQAGRTRAVTCRRLRSQDQN